MAIEKTVILNVETKEATKNVDLLTRSFEDAYGEIQPLTGRMGELEDQLYELANAGKQGTDEFKTLANEVGRMKKTIQQTDAQVDGLAMTTSQRLGGALGGVTSGFELAQGAMGALGAESGAVQEALLKVQSAMAIAQGVQGIKESIPAFKAMAVAIGQTAIGQKLLNVAQIAGAATMKVLNFIMKQNPILLIVSAVAALVAAFALLGNAEEDEAAKQERLVAKRKKAEEQLRSEIDLIKQKQRVSKGNATQLENELKILQSKGATDEQVYKKEKEILNKRIQDLAYIKGYRGKLSNEEAVEYNNLLTQKQVLTNEYNKKIQEKESENAEKSLAKRKEINKQREDGLKKIAELERAYSDSQLTQQQLDLLNIERKYKEEFDIANKYKKDTTQLTEAKNAEIKKINDKYDAENLKKQQELNAQRIELEDQQFKLLQEATLTGQEKEIADLVTNYDAKFAIANGNDKLEKALKQKQKDDIQAINDKYHKEKEDKDKAAAEKELAATKTLQDAKWKAVKDGLEVISNVSELFAGKTKASQKRAFEVQKGVNIAMATIDTFRAAQSAYASGATINPIFGAIAAAAAVTAGLANIKKISQTKFDEGGGASASSGGGATPQVPQVQAANFNVVGTGGANQLAQLGANPVKAYVVSGDVTTAQSLERNVIKNATL